VTRQQVATGGTNQLVATKATKVSVGDQHDNNLSVVTKAEAATGSDKSSTNNNINIFDKQQLTGGTNQLAVTKAAKSSGGNKYGNNPSMVTNTKTATGSDKSSTIHRQNRNLNIIIK